MDSEVFSEADATLTFNNNFELEADYDFLKFDNVPFTTLPSNRLKRVSAGTVMTFTSDESEQKIGFRFCATGSKFLQFLIFQIVYGFLHIFC